MSESGDAGFSVKGGAGSIAADLEDMARSAAVLARTSDALADARKTLVGLGAALEADLAATRTAARVIREPLLGGGLVAELGDVHMAPVSRMAGRLTEDARTLAGESGDRAPQGRLGASSRALQQEADALADSVSKAESDYRWAEVGNAMRFLSIMGRIDLGARLLREVGTEINDPGGTITSDIAVGAYATVFRHDVIDGLLRGVTALTVGRLPGIHPATALEKLSTVLYNLLGSTNPLRTEKITVDELTDPPTELSDFVREIDELYSAQDASPGTFTVFRYDRPDGTPAWVVAAPGTQTWQHDHNPLGPFENLRLQAGEVPFAPAPALPKSTATGLAPEGDEADSLRAAVQAMEEAGIGPDDPVMLVGHSQGGMIAAALAALAAKTTSFTVAGVVTLGSPTGNYDLSGIDTLEIAHLSDPVAGLDGRPARGGPRRTQITVDLGRRSPQDLVDRRSVAGSHGTSAYGRTAADVDVSPDPSVRSWRERVGAKLKLTTATKVTRYRVQVLR